MLEGLEISLEGGGGLEGREGALSLFNHTPNYTVFPIGTFVPSRVQTSSARSNAFRTTYEICIGSEASSYRRLIEFV